MQLLHLVASSYLIHAFDMKLDFMIMKEYKLMVKGIVSTQDKYLILQSWRDDRIAANPYEWVFVDGKLEYPEGLDAAMLRLVKEQTGLDVMIERILYTWSFMSGDICNIGVSYACMAFGEEVVLSEEFVEYKWVAKEEIINYVENKMVIDDLLKAEII